MAIFQHNHVSFLENLGEKIHETSLVSKIFQVSFPSSPQRFTGDRPHRRLGPWRLIGRGGSAGAAACEDGQRASAAGLWAEAAGAELIRGFLKSWGIPF